MRKKRIIILSLLFLFVVTLGIVIYISFFKKDKEVKEVEVLETIDEYNYVLEDNETDFFIENFNELKECLSQDEVDKEEYASLITKLFISDFFTLDNKISKNDVGGIQFVYIDYQDDFKNYAKESIYKNIKSNIYGDREQELPIVTDVIIDNINESTFTYNEEEYNSYVISLTISYEEDLDYPTTKEVTVIDNDDILAIAKLS